MHVKDSPEKKRNTC